MSQLTKDNVAQPSEDVRQIRAHIEGKFNQVQIEPSPFPHLLIENFFPDDIFASILNLNPFQQIEGEEWIKNKASTEATRVNSTPYHRRRQINLSRGLPDLPNQAYRELWQTLRDCFLGPDHWFENLIIQKYKAYFENRFGDLLDQPDFCDKFQTEFFLQRHRSGYYIGPHTDVPTRIFTCIFSFAEQEGFEEYGTQMCVPKNPMQRCWGNKHHSWENFDVVKVAPYKPNNFFLFFKTRQSFHAVKTIDLDIPNERYGMQFQFYEPPGGLFEDLSSPDLMKTKHHHRSKSTANQLQNQIKRLLRKIKP